VRCFAKTGQHARLRETVPQQCEQVARDLQTAYRLPVPPGLQLEFAEAAQRVRDAITVTVFLAQGRSVSVLPVGTRKAISAITGYPLVPAVIALLPEVVQGR
jgi:hypothetical protein